MVKELTKAEREALRTTLREMRHYNNHLAVSYPFRQATCRKLASYGFASVASETVHLKRPRYNISAAGRAALKEMETSDD